MKDVKRKGISELVAILFLIMTVIAASGILYAIYTGMIGAQMKIVSLSASGELLGDTPNGYLTLKNTGNVKVQITEIKISTGGTSVTIVGTTPALPQTLDAGQSISIGITAQSNFVTGNVYSVDITYADISTSPAIVQHTIVKITAR